MTTLKQLEELAKKATPGPWEYTRIDCDHFMARDVVMRGNAVICEPVPSWNTKAPEIFPEQDNGEYIAACSPDVILSLIHKLNVAKEALEFFAEPFTWSRVYADAYASQIGKGILDNMYGSKARQALEEIGE